MSFARATRKGGLFCVRLSCVRCRWWRLHLGHFLLALLVSGGLGLAAQEFTADAGLTVERVGIFPTGRWPKQVVFTPDSTRILVPLLEAEGFDLITLASRTVRRIEVPQLGAYRNFPEGVFAYSSDRFLLSQMSTNRIHVFDYPDLVLRRSVASGGTMPKVIAPDPGGEFIAVSHWIGHTVTILDGRTFELLHTLQIPQTRTPRGLAITPDGSHLLVAYYGSGHICVIDTQTWQASALIHVGGAPRHVVIDATGTVAYISDLANPRIAVFDIPNRRVLAWVPVGVHPNTIDLSPDGRLLFVSSRGPNDPVDYTRRSPENGAIYVVDTVRHQVVGIIDGGNQPTGLDVSPDGNLLAFSNFQDNNVEVYRIVR